MYGLEQRPVQGSGGETCGKDILEDACVDGRIILRWIFRKWVEGMDWIYLAQDRNSWRALLNAVMDLRVPYNAREFLEQLRTGQLLKKDPAVRVSMGHITDCFLLEGGCVEFSVVTLAGKHFTCQCQLYSANYCPVLCVAKEAGQQQEASLAAQKLLASLPILTKIKGQFSLPDRQLHRLHSFFRCL